MSDVEINDKTIGNADFYTVMSFAIICLVWATIAFFLIKLTSRLLVVLDLNKVAFILILLAILMLFAVALYKFGLKIHVVAQLWLETFFREL